MIRISLATTALGVAVMILSLAVVFGFKSEISAKVDGFVGRLQVTALAWGSQGETPVSRVAELEEWMDSRPEVEHTTLHATRSGVFKSDAAVVGVALKGVESADEGSFWRENLVEGELPRMDSVRRKDVLISSKMAALLDVTLGDKVEFMFVEMGAPARRDRYRVCGIYDTGFGEMDGRYAITDIRNVQRLAGWESNQISGYEIHTREGADVENLAYELYVKSIELESDSTPLMVVDVVEQNPTIFDWLKAHDVNAVVIITIMFVVSLLAALSALLIMLLERTRTIGILKALGMPNGDVQRIFLYRSLFVAIQGVVLGDLLGVGLCLAQKHLHLVKLDSEGYFLSEVPIDIDLWSVLAVDLGVIALLMAVLALPTMIITKIKPDKTIRYQ